MNQSTRDVQPFAWSGIALTIPAEWETGELGSGYALLEYRFRPVLELKTAVIRGRFSFRRHLKQLARSVKDDATPPLELIPPPPAWPAFPSTSQVKAFVWQGTRMGGQGLVHYCRTCHRATLIQFYHHGDHGLADAPWILASFRDHSRQSDPTFAVYDIQATLPEKFELTRFQFEAGRFTLVFGHAREILTLWRWSPADVILEACGGDLAGVVRNNNLLPPAAAIEAGQYRGNGVEWQWRGKHFRNGLNGLFRQHAQDTIHALRIWHRPQANRILAVRAEGVDGHPAFDRICRSYGIIQKEKTALVAG